MNLDDKIKEQIPSDILGFSQEIAKEGDKSGQKVVLVGGVVRDLLLERPVIDADIMAEPPVRSLVETVAERRALAFVAHEKFFTFSVRLPSGKKVDVVTAREEMYPAPAMLPTVKPSTIEADLKRRDFTVNAMACSLNKGTIGAVIDPFNGAEDLRRKEIRVLHEKSFIDDPTRIFRAARFAGRFGFALEQQTGEFLAEALREHLPALLSATRRRHEFELILKEPNPVAALTLLNAWGGLQFIHSEWSLFPEHLKCLMEWAYDPADPSLLVRRLVHWFMPWGEKKAGQMMLDLGFEKRVKKEVLSRLTAGPSSERKG